MVRRVWPAVLPQGVVAEEEMREEEVAAVAVEVEDWRSVVIKARPPAETNPSLPLGRGRHRAAPHR
jgi:hypothetical protein